MRNKKLCLFHASPTPHTQPATIPRFAFTAKRMDSKLEEEKKESAEKMKGDEDCGSRDGDEDEEFERNDELVDLPEELSDLRNKRFETERELQDVLDKRRFGDLRVVLLNDGTARQFMPGKQHNRFTDFYVFDFLQRRPRWGHCSATHKIHLTNGRSRDPDISYWGYPRCDKHPYTGDPCLYDNKKDPIPDVVIQFSWGNDWKYEKQAFSDLMNEGLEHDDGPLSTDRPRLGYLIKGKRSKKKTVAGKTTRDVLGFDIYRLLHGTTVDQAEHWIYKPGDPEVFVSIRPEDLGIPPTLGTRFIRAMAGQLGSDYGDEYTLEASQICTIMSNLSA
jgi:hypothetical protein